MGFQIASLIGGMASGYASKVEEEEKQGRKFGEFAFSTLYDNYKTSKKDYDERQNLYIDTATKLREYSNNYGYDVSEGELKEAISSPAFVSEFSRAMTKPDFDPSKVEWQKLFSKVDKTKAGEFTGKVEDFIKGEFKMPTATEVAEGALPTQKPTSSLYAGAREKGYKTTFEGAAKASGIPMENLMGVSGGVTPKTTISGSKSQFEFSAFRPMDVKDIAAALARERYQITTEENPSPDQAQRLARNEQNTLRLKEAITSVDPNADSFTTMKSNAFTALAYAKQTGDEKKITAATNKLTNIMETEYIAESMFGKGESHEKAMARLESVAVKISRMPKGPERTQLEEMNDAEMKTRANFVKKMREASGLSEGEKDRQVGLATLAAMTRRVIFQEMLPAGAISTQADGSFTINSLPGVKDEQIKAAAMATQERLIKMLTKDGVPVDNASRQILMANSVNFDGSGRAVVNRDLGLPSSLSTTPTPAMPSQPSAATTPSKTLTMPPVAAPTAPTAAPAKPGIDITAERQRASNAIAQGAPADKVKALFKQKTGQDY